MTVLHHDLGAEDTLVKVKKIQIIVFFPCFHRKTTMLQGPIEKSVWL